MTVKERQNSCLLVRAERFLHHLQNNDRRYYTSIKTDPKGNIYSQKRMGPEVEALGTSQLSGDVAEKLLFHKQALNHFSGCITNEKTRCDERLV